ncbi:hypothetical protein [Streptomyces collinus]|uniref:hypothetical protein n=1 Tax=Streptomyces collinus TaxID=42684 RepID=UPI003F54010E
MSALVTRHRALITVSAASNRSKADQDPTTWLPPAAGCRCQYVTDWIADKTRWDLDSDTAEQAALTEELSGPATRKGGQWRFPRWWPQAISSTNRPRSLRGVAVPEVLSHTYARRSWKRSVRVSRPMPVWTRTVERPPRRT